ncbi:MAG TPA: GDSL-type esterase/lipase family protein [Thermoanaerobaculia bacterium]|nr:GDSL-type esterase/lipase family protein [Thermoanaerobaculia bacterium]
MPSNLSPSGKRLVRLLLLGSSLFVSLLAAELAVRLARPQAVMTVSRGLYQPDPPRRYRIAPGFRGTITNQVEFDTEVATNSLGLRGPEAGPKRGLRILALGDSFTFGVGAEQEETWPARLAEILGAEVLNAGAPGFGVPDAVAWYEQYGVELEPDVLVLAVFLANDLQDASPDQPKVAVVNGELVVPGETGGLRRWLYYNSHLFRLLKSSVLEGRARSLVGMREPWAVRELRSEFSMYSPALPEELRRGAEATERAVAKLAQSRSKVVAVLVPSLPQVDPARWQAVLSQLGLDPARHDPRRPNRLFREIFERHGVPVVDLTDTFQEAVGRGERIYYPIDQHLTPAGYELMARSVGEALR